MKVVLSDVVWEVSGVEWDSHIVEVPAASGNKWKLVRAQLVLWVVARPPSVVLLILWNAPFFFLNRALTITCTNRLIVFKLNSCKFRLIYQFLCYGLPKLFSFRVKDVKEHSLSSLRSFLSEFTIVFIWVNWGFNQKILFKRLLKHSIWTITINVRRKFNTNRYFPIKGS